MRARLSFVSYFIAFFQAEMKWLRILFHLEMEMVYFKHGL